jgi:hypothetical protein
LPQTPPSKLAPDEEPDGWEHHVSTVAHRPPVIDPELEVLAGELMAPELAAPELEPVEAADASDSPGIPSP